MEQICANNMDTKGVTSGMIYHHIRKSVEDNENYTLGFFYTNWQETVSQSLFTPTSCLWTNRTRIVCDIAYPSVWRVDTKNEEKINKYLDLAIQIKELRKMKSVNLSSLLSKHRLLLPKRLEGYLKNINAGIELTALQRTVLLGSARILRRVL